MAHNMIESGQDVRLSVSEFVDMLNQTYEFAFPGIVITGELANLKVSRNKWVYFDLKDDAASVKFFGTVYHLPGPLEDGMLLHVRGTPHMHERFGFSVNVQTIQPAGEGSIRRAAELLAAKLQAEGLFEAARKRPLPYPPRRIGLITSAQSAAYADFIKILGARWGGLQIDLIDVQVQGEVAPAQIVEALARFNALADPPEVLVLIRGGGSADDLAAFSTEQVTRAVAASRVPTLVAIGHEVDVSLAELAADRRASTPSNAAELLVPDKRVVLESLASTAEELYDAVQDRIFAAREGFASTARQMHESAMRRLHEQCEHLARSWQLLEVLSPEAALKRGYAIVRTSGGAVVSGTGVTGGTISGTTGGAIGATIGETTGGIIGGATGVTRGATAGGIIGGTTGETGGVIAGGSSGVAELPAVGDIVHIELLRARLEAQVIKVERKVEREAEWKAERKQNFQESESLHSGRTK